MSQKCPKSCGICKLCPTTEPPNRDLPPTPLSCSEGKYLVYMSKPTTYSKKSIIQPFLVEGCSIVVYYCFKKAIFHHML